MDGSKKKWLINRGGEILGPLSAEEILGGLHDGEFDPKMEIKAPGTGWRGMAHFPEVAGQLRSAGLNLQTTDTSTNTTAQLTGTTTVQDQTTTDPMDADDLPEATVVWPLKEKDLEPSVVQAPVRPPPQPGPVKTYQWEPNRTASTPQRVSSWILWSLVVLLAGFGGWTLFKYQGTSPVTTSSDQIVDQANRQLEMGKFREALALYRQVLQLEPRHMEAQRKMVPLLLVVEGQFVEATRRIQQMQMTLTRPEDLAEVFNLKGLTELYGERWVEARSSFSKSLEYDPIYSPARWNRAMAYYMGSDFDSSATDFSALQSAFPQSAPLMYLLSLAQVKGNPHEDFPFDLVSTGHFSFQQEAFFLGLWAAVAEGRTQTAEAFAKNFLTSDMDLSDLHYRDPRFYMKPLTWTHLREMCPSIDGSSLEKWLREAVQGLCALKVRDLVGARDLFERSLARTPGSFVQSLLAKVYMVQGEVERAKLLLAGVSAQNPLADVLFLRLHEKDGFMSEQMDRANRLKDPRFSLQREYYLSKIALQERHVDKAKYHFRRAQGLSEEFLPLKSLESRLYNE